MDATPVHISLMVLALVLSQGQTQNYPPLFDSLMNVVGDTLNQMISEPRDEPRLLKEYDFIIVGAGSAGCVIANRLSEISDWKILLIEAGMGENFIMDIPIVANFLQFSPANWNYKTIQMNGSCLGMSNNQCRIPRGKVMGGSSVLNYMIFTRGHRNDYDQWATNGCDGWNYDNVKPFFIKSEDNRIENDNIDSLYHRKGGYLTVSEIPFKTPIANAFVKAGAEMGYPIVDVNGAAQIGYSYLPVSMRNGTRWSTSRAFLHPIRRRRNLHVTKFALVTKIIIDEKSKKALGVEITKGNSKLRIFARKEVILSAGAINSPQLLMLSGIGPREHLREKQIKVIKDLKVGYNLQDHVALGGLTFTVNDTVSIKTKRILDDPMSLDNYFKYHKGPLTIPGGAEAIAFYDLNQPGNPAGWPNLELLLIGGMLSSEETLRRNFGIRDDVYNKVYKETESMDGYMILPMVMRPKSFGRVFLKDSNPKHHPLINMNYFSDPNEEDLNVLVAGVRKSQELLKSPAMRHLDAKLYPTPLPGCSNYVFDSDDYWKCHARQFSFTIYHQSGTCKMGPASDPDAVVDPQLRVHGIANLRVIDASIMPLIPSAHTNAPTIMIAEKGSDMVKKAWNKR
uniref:Glucose dehydrogenase [FAD, quinone] n=1 Tax=Cacopsylla melanoneura TaxID=428564 RepID=A0A8D9AH87_9HEMI